MARDINGILLDTGASAHVFCNKKYFTSFDPNFDPAANIIELADGSRHSDLIEGKGTVVLNVDEVNGINSSIFLYDTLLVP